MHAPTARAARLRPRPQVVLPDAGHRCYEDQPSAFNAVLLRFLNKCYRKPDSPGVVEVRPDSEVRVRLLDGDLAAGEGRSAAAATKGAGGGERRPDL